MLSESDDLRLAGLEYRVARIERVLQTLVPPTAAQPAAVPTSEAAAEFPSRLAAFPPSTAAAPPPPPITTRPRVAPPPHAEGEAKLIGGILGWGGALALVLAASYLIRLAIDNGWLTPIRQVAFAATFGVVLVAAGFAMRAVNRQYAGLLPAAGVAVLFLAIYGGHLYHQIIGVREAGVAILIVCAASLWLCRAFSSDMYALFAVAGSYTAPLLLRTEGGSITDLAIYFTAWSVVFGIFAVWHGRRLIYLLAAYLAFFGFDVAWRHQPTDHWIAVLAFQTAQFAIFGVATAAFSVRRSSPLDEPSAVVHLPPLLLFYFLQYTLLKQHLPDVAPWIAVGSLAALALLYQVSRMSLKRPLPGGELLLASYAALVLFHAGYIEAVPQTLAPWIALVAAPLVALGTLKVVDSRTARWPLYIAAGIMLLVNYMRVVFGSELNEVPMHRLLAVAYAMLLYAGYWMTRNRRVLDVMQTVLLYLGHTSAMAAALHLLNEPILQSAAWGVLAVGCLVLSLRLSDKMLGQSSLAVFGAAAIKVLLLDLKGASPIARIVGLVVLGVALYAGGMLYQRLVGAAAQDHRVG